MSYEVKNFIRKIVFTVIAFAALCIFCFDMFGSTGNNLLSTTLSKYLPYKESPSVRTGFLFAICL